MNSVWESLKLGSCNHLGSVVLHAGFEGAADRTWSDHLAALQRLPSCVRRISIVVHECDIKYLKFEELASELSRFDQLERLLFDYRPDSQENGRLLPKHGQLQVRAEAGLPSLARRGILHVCASHDPTLVTPLARSFIRGGLSETSFALLLNRCTGPSGGRPRRT